MTRHRDAARAAAGRPPPPRVAKIKYVFDFLAVRDSVIRQSNSFALKRSPKQETWNRPRFRSMAFCGRVPSAECRGLSRHHAMSSCLTSVCDGVCLLKTCHGGSGLFAARGQVSVQSTLRRATSRRAGGGVPLSRANGFGAKDIRSVGWLANPPGLELPPGLDAPLGRQQSGRAFGRIVEGFSAASLARRPNPGV
jgi:hypothetical protein